MNPSERKQLLSTVRRAVIKVGSGVLTRKQGLNLNVIDDLTADICHLRRRGMEVILVSSGAIAAGLRKLGIARRPDALSQLQALAAMGQSHLIETYEKAFARHGAKAAQLLLTRDDLTHRRRYLNARNTLLSLLSWKIIPIINENDTVAVDEIKFGDNDNLGAMVTNLTESHMMINLTNLDGLYDKDPRQYTDACLIDTVYQIDAKIKRMAGSIPGFLGTGGMGSKIAAAEKIAMAGSPTIIANGLRAGILREIFAGKPVGTLFMPKKRTLNRKQHWIAFTQSPKGDIVIDPGAEKAILEKGKSLLPSGIRTVKGRFTRGNAVVLRNEAGDRLAIGLVNYHSGEILKIVGVSSEKIESVLGYRYDDEIIHRDNLILTAQLD